MILQTQQGIAPITRHNRYFFESRVADALERNRARPEPDRVPDVGIFTANKRLELPSRAEGFDEFYFVRFNGPDTLNVEEWKE